MKNLIYVGGNTYIEPSEVSYFQADENYTIIHYNTGRKTIVPTTLKLIQQKIGEEYGFVRPNRMLLINPSFINDYDSGEISLQNNFKVVISRRREAALHKILSNYSK